MKYLIRARETGDVINDYPTRNDVEEALIDYEGSDKDENIYSENFYEIVKELYLVESDTESLDIYGEMSKSSKNVIETTQFFEEEDDAVFFLKAKGGESAYISAVQVPLEELDNFNIY